MKQGSKELFHNKWLSLWDVDGYTFSHETRSNGNLVAILIFDSTKPDTYYGRYEICPAHDDGMELCSITGGVDGGDVVGTALHEIKEEAGFDAKKEELYVLGTVRPSKSADTVASLYAWDCKGQEQGEAVGDGSEGEKGAYCKPVTKNEAIMCKDPLMATMIARFESLKPNLEKVKFENWAKTVKE